MSDFHITFANPWLLFLLVPAFAVTLIWYFKINKKYRRTRNRIISVVLHLVVTLIATTLLAGMRFEYKVANQNNEIILLVDVSESENFSEEERDEFVGTVLNQSRFDNYKVGVVTFGFDQKYAVPLTYDVNGIFSAYVAADLPDDGGGHAQPGKGHRDVAALRKVLRHEHAVHHDGLVGMGQAMDEDIEPSPNVVQDDDLRFVHNSELLSSSWLPLFQYII